MFSEWNEGSEKAKGTGTLSPVTQVTLKVYLISDQTAVVLSSVRREFGQSHLSDRFKKCFSSPCHPENTHQGELGAKPAVCCRVSGCGRFRVAHVSELQ